MTVARPDAWNLLDGKLSVPAELRTAEWAMVPQWLRERVFYMAAVNRAEIIDYFRSEVAAIASGERGLEESRKRLESAMDAAGYRPEPGQQGTIKDLRSMRRIQTSLRTNVTLLQGWGQKNRGLKPGALAAFPGWELVRLEGRRNPRDWQMRFRRAGGRVITGGRMIAPKLSAVWHELGNGDQDSIGTDYPPFAWGSGMGWRQVDRAEMERLGIPTPAHTPPQGPLSSPNESLETIPRVTTRAIRDELSKTLGGLARWNGETLVFTDPNGTRRMTGSELAQVWRQPMPAVFSDLPGGGQIQREALLSWAEDHSQFEKAGDTNAWADLLRVANRIVSAPVETLWRGMAMSTEQLGGFLGGLAGKYSTRPEFPLESWTSSLRAATAYARTGGRGWSVILNVRNPRNAADISAIVRDFAAVINKQPAPPIATESEWVYTAGRSFRVLDVKKDAAARTVQIELEEIP